MDYMPSMLDGITSKTSITCVRVQLEQLKGTPNWLPLYCCKLLLQTDTSFLASSLRNNLSYQEPCFLAVHKCTCPQSSNWTIAMPKAMTLPVKLAIFLLASAHSLKLLTNISSISPLCPVAPQYPSLKSISNPNQRHLEGFGRSSLINHKSCFAKRPPNQFTVLMSAQNQYP